MASILALVLVIGTSDDLTYRALEETIDDSNALSSEYRLCLPWDICQEASKTNDVDRDHPDFQDQGLYIQSIEYSKFVSLFGSHFMHDLMRILAMLPLSAHGSAKCWTCHGLCIRPTSPDCCGHGASAGLKTDSSGSPTKVQFCNTSC